MVQSILKRSQLVNNADPPRLYVHSLESARLGDGLGDGLGASVLRSLSKRAVLLSRSGDMVIVDSMPDSAWLEFLGSIGIDHGEIHVAVGTGETLIDRMLSDETLISDIESRFDVLEPYMGGDQVQQLAQAIHAQANVPDTPLLNRLNLKSNLCPILGHAGLPTIPTTIASRTDALSTAKHMFHEYGSVMVRSDLSIGGLGVWAITSDADLDALSDGIAQARSSRLFVLQPLLDVTGSPNAQYEIRRDAPRFLGISSQTMTQSFAFGGNDYPSPQPDDRIRTQADTIAHWLHNAGYRGMVGIDFIISPNQGVFIVEINPRVNTSTFPLLLKDRLGASAFRLITGISTPGIDGHAGIMDLIGEDRLYHPSRGAGVVPLMIPSVDRAVLDVMIFGSQLEQVAELSDDLLIQFDGIGSEAQAAGGQS